MMDIVRTLEVTTEEDIVDATDGVLSLREAVLEANQFAGKEKITFSSDLLPQNEGYASELFVTISPIEIEDDLVLDGRINGDDRLTPEIIIDARDVNQGTSFEVNDAEFTITNANLRGNGNIGNFIRGSNADITIQNSELTGSGGYSYAIGADGGSVSVLSSNIDVYIRDDTQDPVTGGPIIKGQSGAEITIDSSFLAADTNSRYTVDQPFLETDGVLNLTNSTLITDITSYNGRSPEIGILLQNGADATITSTTIAKTENDGLGETIAINVEEGADLTIAGSLIVGDDFQSINGDFTDGGGNIFGDRDNTDLPEVFGAPEAVNNGGPSLTLGLRLDPSNPAINAGAGVEGLPQTDQRGEARDSAPDAGAFEVQSPDPADLDNIVRTLVVNTLDDIVDPDDGVLSLREAVEQANDFEGAERITFADELFGSTIFIDTDLEIIDPLVIDGSTADRGRYGIEISGNRSPNPYTVNFNINNTTARLEDLTILGGGESSGGSVQATNAYTTLERVFASGIQQYSFNVYVRGGQLNVNSSLIRGGGETSQAITSVDGADIVIRESLVDAGRLRSTIEARGEGSGSITIEDSTVRFNGLADQINLLGNEITAIETSDNLTVTNSTIESTAYYESYRSGDGFDYSHLAISLLDGADARITSSTIAGNDLEPSPIEPSNIDSLIDLSEGSELVLTGSLVTGAGLESVNGSFTDGGGNILGDRDNVEFLDVLATTSSVDNGGPTPTFALVDSASNPAIGAAAEIDGIPELDQRGVARDAAPDAGAFEAGAVPPGVEPPPEEIVRTLEVTIAEDVIDVTDGELSLREAVNLANGLEGLERIEFSQALAGQAITIDQGDLFIRDSLILDGGDDALGSAATTIEFPDGMDFFGRDARYGIFGRNTDVRFEDLSFVDRDRPSFSEFLNLYNTDAVFERVSITSEDNGTTGINAFKGSLRFEDSELSGNSRGYAFELRDVSSTEIINSSINWFGSPNLYSRGSSEDSIRIESSTFENTLGRSAQTAIKLNGTTGSIVNSSIQATSYIFVLENGANLSVTSSTIVGDVDESRTETQRSFEIDGDSSATIAGNIIVGDTLTTVLSGGIADLGGNILGDRDDVSIGDVLETDRPQDNGGPTPTFALVESAGNPAIGAAAGIDGIPELDQRGVARDAAPDAGAFEAGEVSVATFPELVDKQAVAVSEINGVDRDLFVIGEDGDAILKFAGENAGLVNTLGVYLVDDRGFIINPKIVFSALDSNAGEPSDGEVRLSDLYDEEALQPGTQFNIFLISDGASLNSPDLLNPHNTFEFITDGELGDTSRFAGFSSVKPRLFHLDEDGGRTEIQGDIFHAASGRGDSANPLSNQLNPNAEGTAVGTTQTLSGVLDDEFLVGFEDTLFNEGDMDFNDVLISVETEAISAVLNPAATALSAVEDFVHAKDV